MRKIEPQTLVVDVGAFLRDMFAEYKGKRLMQQMGRRVILCRRVGVLGKSAFRRSRFKRFRRFLVLFFRFFKACRIDGKTIFSGKFLRQFNWKTERIVQAECNASRNFLFGILHKIGQEFLEFRLAFPQRFAEFIFFRRQLCANLIAVLRKFGIGNRKVSDNGFGNTRKKGVFNAKFPSVAYCASYQAAENVACAYIGRRYSPLVAENENRRARMVGNNPNAFIFFIITAVRAVRKFLYRMDNRLEDFGEIDARLSL